MSTETLQTGTKTQTEWGVRYENGDVKRMTSEANARRRCGRLYRQDHAGLACRHHRTVEGRGIDGFHHFV